MYPEDFKKKVREIITQEYKVEFLGKNFDQIVGLLSDFKAEKIYSWLEAAVERRKIPLSADHKKYYKEWKTTELLTFRYPFVIDRVEYRILLVKVKSSFYIEFHLGNHKYYDNVRYNLGLSN